MQRFRTIDYGRLLGRAPIEVDMGPVEALMRGRRVLVTGAAGSIGRELAAQLAALAPEGLWLVDQAETPLHDLDLALEGKAEVRIANCADREAMVRIMNEARPEVVFHAAAYKHVPMMERNPHAAVVNNVLATKVLSDLAAERGVERFVMISTDKAVNPTNVMGASKRVCELYVQSLNGTARGGATHFITTRFGNVLGSQGSVIPLFEQQLRHGGPLTVTHREVRRFFMLIPEACRLVLLAAALGRGGEIFAFDMGEPVRIADLARRMIALGGQGNERIVFTGLRPGEKLYEEVLTADELTLPGPHAKIKVARVRPAEYSAVGPAVDALIGLARCPGSGAMDVVRELKRLVPEFRSRNSRYEILDSAEPGNELNSNGKQ